MKIRREKDPAKLGIAYRDLCCVDFIKVELLPEKQGLILKHVEYEITSLVRDVKYDLSHWRMILDISGMGYFSRRM